MEPAGIQLLFLLIVFVQLYIVAAVTGGRDAPALIALTTAYKNFPPSWLGSDPCGDGWVGIRCTNSRVTSIILPSMGLEGQVFGDILFLTELQTLDLSYNKGLTGSLPPSIGNLTKLTNLNLIGCGFTGPIPDTIGNLQQLTILSLNSNNFGGQIPPSIGNLSNLYWLDLAENQLVGPIPVSDGTTLGLDKLVHAKHFHLGKNKLSGEIPEQIFSSSMTLVHVLFDNNKLSGPIPSTLGLVQSLQVIRFDNNSLSGSVPSNLNDLTSLQELSLSYNKLNGSLPTLIGMSNLNTSLVGNPICEGTEATKNYCVDAQSNFNSSYTTPPSSCPPARCSSDQVYSPECRCAYPYTGILNFRGIFFSDLGNSTRYEALQTNMTQFFIQFNDRLVDLVSLSYPRMDPYRYLLLNLSIFPFGTNSFNRTGVSTIAFIFSNQTYKPPSDLYGPYVFDPDHYNHFSDTKNSKKSTGIIIGVAVGGSVLLLLSLFAGVYAFRQKKKAERASLESNPFAHWDVKKNSGSIPQLKSARCFSFEELKKYTNNFSETNDIGSGGYGKVYKGTLPNGELVAIKRAQQGSLQGGLEFKTEIELLSRVHHKNVVGLLGFCFERGEQMLIYEHVPNGSLYETLSSMFLHFLGF